MSLNLRDYQSASLDALRQGFADGVQSQVLYAPTGAGKTEMAIALLEATKKKGNKAAMILDRIVLCDQTSQRLAKYKIDHGVLQSGHWRYRPYEPIQVCSAQTLEKRGAVEGLSLLIIDECHAMRKQTIDFIRENPHIKVIGLTATPFTKGIGSVYGNVVSTVTTKALVNQGVLTPLRVFVAKSEIDMTGAKKVAGEWSAKDAEKRGMKITGDIVAEWERRTFEFFKKPEKTIVFCAGVAHGADLAQKFADAGYNFIAISYKDSDDFKREIIEEFSKPDTEINGLIATDILTKGFDVPDVRIGVSARPFSKSLSSHIQQMGRVMRGYPGKDFAIWLDHSGNYLRFMEDWDEVYEAGVSSLEEGKEKARKEPTEKEKKNSKCPSCGAIWPKASNTCTNCGFVREPLNKIESVDGELSELAASGSSQSSVSKQEFWSMLQWYVKHQGWSRGRAAHTYREMFGVWPRGVDDNVVKTPNNDVQKFINKRLRAYFKRKSLGLVA